MADIIYIFITKIDVYGALTIILKAKFMNGSFISDILTYGHQYSINGNYVHRSMVGWLVGCFGLNGPLRQYFSLYRAVSQREGERKEK